MTSVTNVTTLRRFTSFDFAIGIGYLPVWVNPMHVAYVQARRRRSATDDAETLDGTLLYFQQEAGVLAIREPVDEVLAALFQDQQSAVDDRIERVEHAMDRMLIAWRDGSEL